MDSILVELFKHNTWANLRLIDACAGLSEEHLDAAAPGTFGRIRDTFTHLVAAQERYLSLLTGEHPANPLRKSGGFPGFVDLRERALRTSEELAVVAARAEPGRMVLVDWQGQQEPVNTSTLLIQAINHATEHRAHIATIMGSRGIEPPEVDGWAYGEATSSSAQ
jgi:uncharacterized damage-inducible protein DinB